MSDRKFIVRVDELTGKVGGGIDDIGELQTIDHVDKKVKFSKELTIDKSFQSANDNFYDWVLKQHQELLANAFKIPHLCNGARIKIDEDGNGTLTIDDDLPDGEWIIEYPDKTYRLSGVHGPVRVESAAQEGEDVSVSPVKLTFQTREP